MSDQVIEAKQGMRVGDRLVITLESRIHTQLNRGVTKTVDSATVLGYDPDEPTTGTADSDGAADGTTIVDSTRIEADDFFIGMPVTVHKANGSTYDSKVTDFANATGTFTIYAIEEQVEDGDTYELHGQVLLPQEPADTVSGAQVTHEFDSDCLLGKPGERVAVFDFDFGVGESKHEIHYRFTVER